jgi:hypothetical protein
LWLVASAVNIKSLELPWPRDDLMLMMYVSESIISLGNSQYSFSVIADMPKLRSHGREDRR